MVSEHADVVTRQQTALKAIERLIGGPKSISEVSGPEGGPIKIKTET